MASVAVPGQAKPEDADDVVVEPYRLTPKLARRIALLSALLLIGFAALLLRLWDLQVLAGPQYAVKAQANQLRTISVPAPRGSIVDRNGDTLVSNQAVTAVELWPSSLPKDTARRDAELRSLAHVTRVRLHDITKAIVTRRHENDMLDPVVVRANAPAGLVTYMQERASEFQGVGLERSYVRTYPHGALATQLLGGVGQISTPELKVLSKQGYQPGEVIGQSGVEHSFNTYLQGVPGSARVRVDSLGRPRSAHTLVTPAQPGQTVRLTLDTGLQLAAEQGLQEGIRIAHGQGLWAADGGAVVAMNPNTGAILALASAPTYDPSIYTGRVTQKKLDAAGLGSAKSALDHNYPVINRALAAEYPPGSTFKPLTAIAAMQQGILNPYSLLPCTGTYVAPEDKGHRVWHNWDPNIDQGMNLTTALAYSCDTYFYRVGNNFFLLPPKFGQPEQKWARAFGFGAPSGIDVGGEYPGLVPTIGWRERTYTRKTDHCCWQVDRIWKPGDNIQLAIGQGDLTVTPIQMTRFYAAIANGGKLVTPHVLMDVENPNKTLVPTAATPAPKPIPGLNQGYLNVVQQGLYDGTHLSIGTSYGVFGNFPVPIAGKTGTAQKVVTLPGVVREEDQAWWCGYGPVGDPKLVVCAWIENGGHGGTAAAPAAEKVFAKFFNVSPKQAGYIHSD